MLSLPRPAQLSVRSLDPLFARSFLVHLLDVGKFFTRFEDASCAFDGLPIPPLLHHANDVDGDKFNISGYLFAVARLPCCLISELNEGALDDAGALRAILALEPVFPTGKIVDYGWFFFTMLLIALVPLFDRFDQFVICRDTLGDDSRLRGNSVMRAGKRNQRGLGAANWHVPHGLVWRVL